MFPCYVKLKKCRVTRFNWKKGKAFNIPLPSVPMFRVPTCSPITFPEPGPELDNFTLFSCLGYLIPFTGVEDNDEVYFSASSNGVFHHKVGPVIRYQRQYDTASHRLLHYRVWVGDHCYQIPPEAFSLKYSKFTSYRITVNPVLVTEKSSVSAAVLKALQIQDLDLQEFARCVPALTPYLDSATICQMVALFYMFCVERQKRWLLWRSKVEDTGTDQIFRTVKFTNIFRELDRGTQYLREQLLPLLLQTKRSSTHPSPAPCSAALSTVLFKSCVYRLMNRVETFMSNAGIPGPQELDAFLLFIQQQLKTGNAVFTRVHQNMGWTRCEGTLRSIRDNLAKLTSNLQGYSTLEECFNELKGIPNVGNFFAWQILCDLTECQVIAPVDAGNWAALGPGAVKGIELIFEKKDHLIQRTQFLTEVVRQADQNWVSLQVPPPLKINSKMIEHALCEFSKYCRFADSAPTRRLFKSRSGLDDQKECRVCLEKGGNKMFCLLCNRMSHSSCVERSSAVEFCCSDCVYLG